MAISARQARQPWWVRFLGTRIAQGLLIVLGALTISFFLVSSTGSIVDVVGSTYQTPSQRKALEHQLGLDRPVLERYGTYVVDVAHGDFGRQYGTGDPAIGVVFSAFPNTVLLVVAAILIAWPIALAVSVLSVLRQDSRIDWGLRSTLIVLQGLPEFWVALLLVLVFSVNLGWLPSSGFDDGLRSVVLPAVALSLPLIPTLVRLIRGQLLDFMSLELATALRGKGITDSRIVVAHGVRNVLVPTVHFLSLQLGWLLGGTLIVETVFGWPGIGQLLLTSIQNRELAVVQAVVIVIAASYVLLALAADLLSFGVDPRIRRAVR
ncbi:MAG: peptide/nickel transport system permease protein [Solirubrobacteraceae bacterium]